MYEFMIKKKKKKKELGTLKRLNSGRPTKRELQSRHESRNPISE